MTKLGSMCNRSLIRWAGKLLSALAVVVLGTAVASAAVVNWSGRSGESPNSPLWDFEDLGSYTNWLEGVLPGATDDITFGSVVGGTDYSDFLSGTQIDLGGVTRTVNNVTVNANNCVPNDRAHELWFKNGTLQLSSGASFTVSSLSTRWVHFGYGGTLKLMGNNTLNLEGGNGTSLAFEGGGEGTSAIVIAGSGVNFVTNNRDFWVHGNVTDNGFGFTLSGVGEGNWKRFYGDNAITGTVALNNIQQLVVGRNGAGRTSMDQAPLVITRPDWYTWIRYDGPSGAVAMPNNIKWDRGGDQVALHMNINGGRDNTTITLTGALDFGGTGNGGSNRSVYFRSDSANGRWVFDGTFATSYGFLRNEGTQLELLNVAKTNGINGHDIFLNTTNSGNEHLARLYLNDSSSTLTSNITIWAQNDGGTTSWGSNTIGTELASGTATFGGTIRNDDNFAGTPRNVNLYSKNAGAIARFNGVIGGGGLGNDWGITKTGAGTVQLAGANTYTGTTLVNEGILQVVGSGAISNKVTLANNATLDMTSVPLNLGAGSTLSMNNSGTGAAATLLGALTTAGTTIELGALRGDTGTLTVGTAGSGSWAMNAGTVLRMDVGTISDRVNVLNSGGLALNGGTIALFSRSGFGPAAGNASASFPLIGYSGTFSGSLSNIALQPVEGYGRPELTDSGSTIDVTVWERKKWIGAATTAEKWSNAPADVNWQGVNTNAMWPFATQDAVAFDNSGVDSGTPLGVVVNVTENVHASSVWFQNTTKTYTIQGTGGITSDFSPKVLLGAVATLANTGTNVWPGVEVRNGTLKTGATNVLGANASVLLGLGTTAGVLDLSSTAGAFDQTIGSLTTPGTSGANRVVNTYGAANPGSAAPTLTIKNAANISPNVTFGDAAIAGSGRINLAKEGAGTLTMTGNNLAAGMSGTVRVTEGRLQVATANSIGAPTSVILNGGTLGLGVAGPAGKLTFRGYNDQQGAAHDTYMQNGTPHSTFATYFDGLTPSFTGVTNTGGLTTLNWPTTTGDTYGGLGYARADNYVARMSGYIYLTPGTYNFASTSDDGSMVWIDAKGDGTGWTNAVNNWGWQGMTRRGGIPVVIAQPGWYPIDTGQYEGGGGSGMIVSMNVGANDQVDVAQVRLSPTNPWATPVSYGWNIDVSANPTTPTAPSTIDLGTNNSVGASFGNLTIGAQTLQITGGMGSAVQFAGTATFSGTPTFNVASDIRLELPAVFDNGHGFNATGAGRVYLANPAAGWITGTIKAAGSTIEVAPAGILLNGNLAGSGTAKFTGGPITLGGTRTVTVDAGGKLTVANELPGFAGDPSRLVKAGAGRLILTNANGYGGGTEVNAGTLSLQTATSAGSGAITLGGGTLALSGFTAGLAQGVLANQDYTSGNPANRGIVLQAFAGEAQKGVLWADQTGPGGAQWGDNETWCYSGKMYLPNNTVSFAGDIDDDMRVKIDGVWIGGQAWQYGTNVVTLKPTSDGWHDVEFRFHNGGGGAGATSTRNGFIASQAGTLGRGFIYNPVGNNNNLANNAGDVIPMDPGDGSLFRVLNDLTIANDISVTADSGIANESKSVTLTGNFGIGGNKLTVSGAALTKITGSTTLTARPTFNMADSGGTLEIAGTLTGASTYGIGKEGPGRLLISTPGVTGLAGLNMLGGTLEVPNGGSLTANVTAANKSTIAGTTLALNGTRTFTVDAAGILTVAPALQGSPGDSNKVVKEGAGTLVLSGASTFGGGMQINQGTVFASNTLGSGAIQLTGGTLAMAGYSPGIKGGRLDTSDRDWGTPANFITHASGGQYTNNSVSIQAGPLAANATDTGTTNSYWGPWDNGETQDNVNITWVYKGKIYLDPQGGNNVSFVKKFDDNMVLKIDGSTVIENYDWANTIVGTVTNVTTGWHDFELRIGQGGGGAGPNNGWAIGFGVDLLGRGSTTESAYVFPQGTYDAAHAWFDTGEGLYTLSNNLVVTAERSAGGSGLDVSVSNANVTGSLDMGGSLAVNPQLNVTGGGNRKVTISGATNVTSSGRPAYNVAASTTLEIAGAYNGAGKGITKDGAGTLLFSSASPTTLGSVDMLGGTLQAANGLLTGGVTAANTSAMAGAITLNAGSGTFDVAAGGVLNSTAALSGALAINKQGPGMLRLLAANTHNGTTVTAGTLAAGTTTSLGSQPVTLAGGTLQLGVIAQGLQAKVYQDTVNYDANRAAVQGWFSSLANLHARFDSMTPFSVTSTTAGGRTELRWNSADGSNNMAPDLGVTQHDNVSIIMSGQINVPTAGTYYFGTSSDDGTMVWIDGNLVVNNNFFQGMDNNNALMQRGGSIALTAGMHDIVTGFYQGTGGSGMFYKWGTADTTTTAGTFLQNSELEHMEGGVYPNDVIVNASSGISNPGGVAVDMGGLTVNGSQTLNVTGAAGGVVKFAGPANFNGVAGDKPIFNVAPGVTLELANVVNDNTRGFTATGGGSVYLSASSATVAGVIDLAGGGNLKLGTMGLVLQNNVTASGAANSIYGGDLDVNGKTLTVAAGGQLTVDSRIWGAVLTKNGAGTLKLTNTSNSYNTFTSDPSTVINGGTVHAVAPGTLTVGTTVAVNDGGTLALTAGASSPAVAVSGFGGTGTGWTINGNASIAGNVATVTPDLGGQSGSVFLNAAVPLVNLAGGFQAKFTYTPSGAGIPSGNVADGITMILQNDPRGATALGDGGGSRGYAGGAAIVNSIGLAVNIYGTSGLSTAQNGGFGTTNAVPGIDFKTGVPVIFDVTYDGSNLNLILKQGANTVPLPPIFVGPLGLTGSSAYVGFTGGTGGAWAQQDISAFSFSAPAASAPADYVNSVKISGNGSIKILADKPAPAFADATLTGLEMAAGATLNVGAYDGSLANGAYRLSAGTTILNGNATFNVDKNGTGAGRLVLGDVFDGAGAGNVVKTGSGTLVLAGNGYNTGTLKVSGGKVAVNGYSGTGAVTVEAGGAIGGTGTVNAATVVEAGGTVQPGDGAAGTTYFATSLNLNANSLLSFNLDTPNEAGPGTGGNSWLSVLGSLTTGSGITLDVIPGGNWGNGVYHLITFGAGSSINTSGWTVAGTGLGLHDYSFTNTGSGIDLNVAAFSGPTNATWNTTVNDAPWSTGSNWTPAAVPNGSGAVANFKGNASAATLTVNVDGPQTVGQMVFNQTNFATNYSVGGTTHAALTMDNGATNASIAATAGSHAITSQVVTSTASNLDVSVSGGGSLSLTGGISNTLGKTVALSQAGAGALSVGDIVNNGAGVVSAASGAVGVGDISGTGTTSVAAGATLTADSIVQDTLTIGAGGAVIIRETTGAAGAAGANAVPEPGTVLLTLLGGLCLGGWLWRRRQA